MPASNEPSAGPATEPRVRDSLQLAFTPHAPAPSAAQITGNVAAVLYFLATLTRDPEHHVTLDPLAADGLSHILRAAHSDLMEASEFRAGASGGA
jgi:hypothetical protein